MTARTVILAATTFAAGFIVLSIFLQTELIAYLTGFVAGVVAMSLASR